MAGNYISVREASERFGYSDSHIRSLLIKGLIEGDKFANVWMVDAESLQKYKAWMERLGKRKHGLWANTLMVDRAASAGSHR